MHPSTAALLRYFDYEHLPPRLQAISKPVGDLAQNMVAVLPEGPELTTGLRKLLEAKDCLDAFDEFDVGEFLAWCMSNSQRLQALREAHDA